MSKEKIEYGEYCKDDVLNTLGQYLNILSQEIATISAKVVDIDIEYAQEVLMSSGEYALDGKRFKIVQNRYRNRKRP